MKVSSRPDDVEEMREEIERKKETISMVILIIFHGCHLNPHHWNKSSSKMALFIVLESSNKKTRLSKDADYLSIYLFRKSTWESLCQLTEIYNTFSFLARIYGTRL